MGAARCDPHGVGVAKPPVNLVRTAVAGRHIIARWRFRLADLGDGNRPQNTTSGHGHIRVDLDTELRGRQCCQLRR